MGLYILTHRQIPNWNTYFYTPLHMSTLDNPDVKLQVKDYYPKMAELNQLYCELSGIYYVWKNDNDNIKGTVQYRYLPNLSIWDINNILKTKKFIATASSTPYGLGDQFRESHDENGEVWNILVDLAKKSGISQYVIDKWNDSDILFSKNIFITTKEYYDEYASWMFPIIFQLQNILNIHSIEDAFEWARKKYAADENPLYQTRILGFVSERLLTLFILNKVSSPDNIKKEVCVPAQVNIAEQVAIATKYDYLIVGAGLTGCVFANEMHKRGKKCLVIDKRKHIGGNCYSENIAGIDVHKYGPHIFHTNNKNTWEYIQKFGEFRNFINTPVANYEGNLYNLPFNMNTFTRIWSDVKTPEDAINKINEQTAPYNNIEPKNLEQQALKLVGEDIYNTLIKGYTEKQWGRPCSELPAFIIKRLPLRFTFNNNYFNDEYQGIPYNGYTSLFEKMLEGVDVILNEDFFSKKQYYMEIADRILYTGTIDEFFNYSLGHLEYRTLKFEHNILNTNNYQGNAIINYTDIQTPYTRIIEHKHFNKKFADIQNTVITKEYPSEWTENCEPYYPINNERNNELFEQYKQLAKQYENISFCGRLGEYKYYDMDKAIEAILKHKWLNDD